MSRDVRGKMHGGCNIENNLNQTKNLKFKKLSPIVVLTSRILYFHQYSADFTYFVPLARELFSTPGWHFVKMAYFRIWVDILFSFDAQNGGYIYQIANDGCRERPMYQQYIAEK